MSDRFSREKRSRIMSRVRNRSTGPEVQVRKLLHRLGFRFRLHVKTLPGSPDIVLRKHRTVVFVNGCFWHGHPGCPRATRPVANADFWANKIDRNIERDRRASLALQDLGWTVVTVWQCELREPEALSTKLRSIREQPQPLVDREGTTGATPEASPDLANRQ